MPNLTPISLSVIGYGHMGRAMVENWRKANVLSQCDIYGGTNNKPRYTADTAEKITTDVLLIAVKPQDSATLFNALRGNISEQTCVISVMAGISTQQLKAGLGQDTSIIRAMPNLPSIIGKGATALYADTNAPEGHKDMSEALMSQLGTTVWLADEKDMRVVTGLSGSGPGYVFHFVEALAQAGIKNGLNAKTAYALAKQTLIGSAALLDQNHEKTATDLRNSVASKGGTTEAGLNVLMNDLDDLLEKTVEAASKRSVDLSND